jgi:polyhydroxyalkanoate synthesis repressor PhaR
MAEKVVLKKYANRRLYDTEKSAYVTLPQVTEMIREGREIMVVDAETKEDVTAFILTQIVQEEARKKSFLLPVSLLYLLIRHGDGVLSEFFEKYLEQTLKNYLAYKTAADDQFRQWLELGRDFSTRTQKAMSGLTPFQPWMDFFGAREKPKKTEEGEEGP